MSGVLVFTTKVSPGSTVAEMAFSRLSDDVKTLLGRGNVRFPMSRLILPRKCDIHWGSMQAYLSYALVFSRCSAKVILSDRT